MPLPRPSHAPIEIRRLSSKISKRSPAASRIRSIQSVDLLSLVDATGSMLPEIELIRDQLAGLFTSLADNRHYAIRFSAAFYRDHDCERPFSFFPDTDGVDGAFISSASLTQLQAFLHECAFCEGNTSVVEALGAAMHYASELPWSAKKRVLVHLGDEPSHGYGGTNPYDSLELCPLRMTHDKILAALKRANVRCYMVRCGNRSVDAEHQYRNIARETGGAYIDFEQLSSSEDLLAFIELSLAHATAQDIRSLVEAKQRAGALPRPSADALLLSFTESKE